MKNKYVISTIYISFSQLIISPPFQGTIAQGVEHKVGSSTAAPLNPGCVSEGIWREKKTLSHIKYVDGEFLLRPLMGAAKRQTMLKIHHLIYCHSVDLHVIINIISALF